MTTREYLKRYAYVYLYVFAAFLLMAAGLRTTSEAVFSGQSLSGRPVFVIDAGHGGMDGGTVSVTGTYESRINLEIAQRLEKLMGLLGYDTVMVRSTDTDLCTEGETVRQQKNSDLRNRVATVNGQPGALLVSIHQNHFTESKYSGPQVFYASGSVSQTLAAAMQTSLNAATGSRRECKAADSVYLMKNINCPGILVECGFLSNPTEARLLENENYQKKLCAVIAAVLAEYAESGTVQ